VGLARGVATRFAPLLPPPQNLPAQTIQYWGNML